MPLLESFMVNHTIMPRPAVRLAKQMHTPKGDSIRVFDLRFCHPNKEIMSERGIHTLEHLFAGFMREHLQESEIIDISPMGCRTGFYMSTIGEPSQESIAQAWRDSMEDILATNEIPEQNVYQCGTCSMHSIVEAKKIARFILDKEIGVMDNKALALDINTLDSAPCGDEKLFVCGID